MPDFQTVITAHPCCKLVAAHPCSKHAPIVRCTHPNVHGSVVHKQDPIKVAPWDFQMQPRVADTNNDEVLHMKPLLFFSTQFDGELQQLVFGWWCTVSSRVDATLLPQMKHSLRRQQGGDGGLLGIMVSVLGFGQDITFVPGEEPFELVPEGAQ